MRYLIYILIIFFPFLQQDKELKFIRAFESEGDFFRTDALNNIYVVNKRKVAKYSISGEKIAEYSNSSLREITSIDVSDPYRLLLYYKDYNQIVFLDKTMTALYSPVSLDDLGINSVGAVCSSNNSGFWLFNNHAQQLQYYDKNLEPMQQSVNLSLIIQTASLPEVLLEKKDRLFLSYPDTGIIIFDKNGSYNKFIPLKRIYSFQIAGNKIIYYKDGLVHKYDFEFFTDDYYVLPDTSNIIDVRMEQQYIYIFRQNNISLYQITDL
ncbi:MAG: hypothetical protein HY738_04455 [Bacteroidia bacterium]|nr:hypothetical protein [Bacteroidia bacterium]